MDPKEFDRIARRISSQKSGAIRTAGKIEFVKDSGPIRRDIRVNGFKWSPDHLKNLAKILWSTQRSHSYAVAAYRLFSKMPSSGFSPDGLLGGRGYIQSIKDMRQSLSSAVETLSSFTDTIHDEINGDHWKDVSDTAQISDIVQDAEEVKANPEQFIENEFQEDEYQDDWDGSEDSEEPEEPEEPISNPSPEDFEQEFVPDESELDDSDDDSDDDEFFSQLAGDFSNAKDLKKLHVKSDEDPASQLPSGAGVQAEGKSSPEMVMKTTTAVHDKYSPAISKVLKAYESYYESRTAGKRLSLEEFLDKYIIHTAGGSSSIPVETLPGPRVEHIGPGQSGTESGGYGESFGSDDPAGEGLSSGTNMSKPLYEDWVMDGVTGYGNATDGDQTTLKSASRVATLPVQESYSWLPGSLNERNLNYYDLGLSEADTDWMRQHASPSLPPGIKSPEKKIDSKTLWDVDF